MGQDGKEKGEWVGARGWPTVQTECRSSSFGPDASRSQVVPSCCSETNPARYPPTSYLDGQGVAQGE